MKKADIIYELKNIYNEIDKRHSNARKIHKQERNSEMPDIRSKESAWGKIVAYGVSRKMIFELLRKLDHI